MLYSLFQPHLSALFLPLVLVDDNSHLNLRFAVAT